MASTAAHGTRFQRQSWLRSMTQRYFEQRDGVGTEPDQSLDDLAERLGVDQAFAGSLRAYFLARQRLHLSRSGWRASLRPQR